MKLSDEFKVGVFATVALVLLFFGFSFLKGKELFHDTTEFKAVYTDIDQLAESNPVYLYGVKVGKVDDIEFNYQGEVFEINVTMSVTPEVKIPKGSFAVITDADIMGSKAIRLEPAANSTAGFAVDGDMLIGKTDEGLVTELKGALAPLQEKTDKLMSDLTLTIGKINSILNEETSSGIQTSLNNFSVLSVELKRSTIYLNKILSDFQTTSGSLAGSTDKITGTIENLHNFSDSLVSSPVLQTIEEAKLSMVNLNKILSNVNDGNGSMGKLINDPSLFDNINKALQSIDILTKDIKKNPKNYLAPLGKRHPKDS